MKKIIATLFLFTFLLGPSYGVAVTLPDPPGAYLSFDTIINAIFKAIWQLFSGFALVMLLVAGFLFVSAQGDTEKIKKAKTALVWAIVGIIVVIIAASIPGILRNFFP